MVRAMNLTDAKLKGMKSPASGQAEISDAVVPGLRVRTGASGAQTFIVRKRVGGKLRNITLGRYGPRFSLADARKKARAILSDIEAGGDPKAALPKSKGAGNGAPTLRNLVPDYLKAKADRRSVLEMQRTLEKYVLPELGDRLADAVTRGDVTRLIDKISARAPVQARAVHAQLSAFYSWAMPRLDRLPANPCRDAGRPDKPKPRDRVLSDDELRALWLAADETPPPWGPGFQLLILTGQRRMEVFHANRAEFDLEEAIWTIPGARAKNGEAHRVHLSPVAVQILRAQVVVGGSAKLFPADGNGDNGPGGFSKAQTRIRAALAKKLGRDAAADVPEWRLHDIRRTVATGLQRLGIRIDVTEAVLNHRSGSRAGIVAVYQRHEYDAEKRHALERWAEKVAEIVKEY